jgi:glycerol-3-phosphate dehydrogenase
MPAVDLLVIGGGIHGASVARDAALRGLSVTLVEQDDLASGTSSRSSKLVHGGLRYLETAQFGLVREALEERAILLATAPDLVHPLAFLLPDDGGGRPAWQVELGLRLYDRLAGRGPLPRHARLSADAARAFEPALPGAAGARAKGAALYYDAQMNDAGLVVAAALAAARAGARIATRARLVELAPLGAAARPTWRAVVVHAHKGGATETIEARAVVNAAGPWADALRPGAPPALRPTRGTHVVVPALTREHALLLFAQQDRRVLFVLPHGAYSLVGTTDVDDARSPGAIGPAPEDMVYLWREIAARWPAHPAATDPAGATVRAFAGLRPLARGNRARPWDNRREARLVSDGGVHAMIGGKFTTARRFAERVVDRVAADLGAHLAPCTTRTAALPGPGDAELVRARAAWAAGDASTTPGKPALARADVELAIEHGFARTVADVVWRRGPLWVDGRAAAAAAPYVGDWMAERLGWSAAERALRVGEVTEQLASEARAIAAAAELLRGAR